MCLYRRARIKVKVGTHLSEEFEVGAEALQGSTLSSLLFAIVIDIVAKVIKEGT